MQRTTITIGLLTLAALLVVATSNEDRLERVYAQAASATVAALPRLAPCTRLDEVYDDLFYDDLDFDDWPAEYHRNVDAVIEEIRKGDFEINCSASSLEKILEPGPKLLAMARSLPTWKDPANLAKISVNDAPLILQEYLRVYECALVEFRYFLPIEVRDEYYGGRGPFGSLPRLPLELPKLAGELERRGDIIKSELRTSRSVLERTVGVLGTMSRMQALSAEMECVQRASLDLRNASALAAEASTCLPRVWDLKGSLKDLPPEEE